MSRTMQEYVDAMRERQNKAAWHMGTILPMTYFETRLPIAVADTMIAAVFRVLEHLGATDQQITAALDEAFATVWNGEPPNPDTGWTVPPEWYPPQNLR